MVFALAFVMANIAAEAATVLGSTPAVRIALTAPGTIGVRHKSRQGVNGEAGPIPVAIVIDDLGMDVPHTRAAIALNPAISLSFLPYPDETPALSHAAHVAGHQVLVHMPMEPEGKDDPGPLALRPDLLPSEAIYRVRWMLSRVSDYDGANNHMGSRFTASRAALAPVMRELAGRVQFFLDSRTSAQSQAADVARSFGLLSGSRDVFLDDDQSAIAVEKQIDAMEAFARSHGSVIAIGHPHEQTLAALTAWAKRAASRGFYLVPVQTVLKFRARESSGAAELYCPRRGVEA